MTLTTIQQTELLDILGGIPPTECLPLVPTEAQIKKWHRIKRVWTLIKIALSNYFSGNHTLEGLAEELNGDPSFMASAIERYLALYDLLNWGWPDIKNFFKGIEMPAERPGDAFRYILEGKAVDQVLNPGKVSSRALYDGWKQYLKCLGLENQGKLTAQEKCKFESLANRVLKKSPEPMPEYLFFLNACLEACRQSKDKRVRRKLKDYERTTAEVYDEIVSAFHPRKAGRYKS
jgi:hypothetical protein